MNQLEEWTGLKYSKLLFDENGVVMIAETNAVNKIMTWYNVEMETMKDDSTSNIAEFLMQGINMGIIEGRKLLNHKDTNEQINSLVQEYVDMQEDAVEKLKTFL